MDPTLFLVILGLALFFGLLAYIDENLGYIWSLIAGLLFIYLTISLLSAGGGFTKATGITTESNQTLDSANNTIITATETKVYSNVQDDNTELMGWVFLLLGLIGVGGAYSAWKGT